MSPLSNWATCRPVPKRGLARALQIMTMPNFLLRLGRRWQNYSSRFFTRDRLKVFSMLLITSNKPRQLLHIRYIGLVPAEDFLHSREELKLQLAELSPGFSL